MHRTHHRSPFRFTLAFWVVLLSLLVGVLIPHTALASAYVVSKTADTNDGACSADCSLREAITAANASPANDTITFAAGANGTIILTSALPALAKNGTLAITGNGEVNTIISGNNAVQVLQLSEGANVTLNSLTVTAGAFTFGSGIGMYGVYGTDILVLNNVTVSGNISSDHGGGIYN
nr:CSLREA domain-containing protein [Anaerolineae bacterium]